MITALVLQFGGFAQCIAQPGDVDPERVAAANAFLVASRAADQLSEGFKRYPPRSDDYIEQFADWLPDEAARQRFAKSSIASSQRSLAKPWPVPGNSSIAVPLPMQGVSASKS
jgi:hypothetical protein